MLPMKLNLSKMKKISGDAESSTFQHPNGHQIKVAHKALPVLQRKQLERLPVHLDEGTPDGPIQAASPVQDSPDAIASDAAAQQPLAPSGASGSWQDQEPDRAPAQAVAAPAPAVAAPQPSDVAGSYKQGQQAISEEQDVQSKLAKEKEVAGDADLKSRQKLMSDAQENLKNYQNNHNLFMKDYADNHIKPNAYIENMSVPQKVATAIGLLVGGFHSGFSGQNNPAQDWLKSQIDRDLDSQRARMDQQKTLLGANREHFQDMVMANNATRMQMNDIYDHQIQQAANKLGTPQAKANADAAHAKFGLENAELLQKNALRGAAIKAAAGGSSRPESLIPFLVPPEHQKDAIKEAGQAAHASANHDFLMEQFDKAAKENTLVRTIGGIRSPASIIAMNALELPMIHDQEGRVNEFEQKTLQGLHPTPGDLDPKVAEKRIAYENFILGKQQTPTIDTYAPQLSAKFKAQSAPQGNAAPKAGDIMYVKGQKVQILNANGDYKPI